MTPRTPLERVALTVRIPLHVKQQAERYCASRPEGMSLNTMVTLALVALMDDAAEFERRERFTDAASWERPPAPARKSSAAPVTPAPQAKLKPPKSPRDKCPCGSGQQWRHCHGRARV